MANNPGLPPEKLTTSKMLVKVVVEEEPPDKKQKVEVTEKDRFKVITAEYVAGTRRIKRFTFRIKPST